MLKGRVALSSFGSANQLEMSAPHAESEEGVCLGMEGLSGKLKRLTTCTSRTDCVVLHFSTHGLQIDAGGLSQLAARASLNVVMAALRGNNLFEDTSERLLHEVAPCFRVEEVSETGERLRTRRRRAGSRLRTRAAWRRAPAG